MLNRKKYIILILILFICLFFNTTYAKTINEYTKISPNSVVENYVYGNNEIYYKINLDSSGIIKFNSFSSSSQYDDFSTLNINIYDKDYKSISQSYISSQNNIVTKYLETGAYYIAVNHYTNNTSIRTDFKFNISFTPHIMQNDNIEPNSYTNKYKFQINTTLYGTSDNKKEDYLQFTINNPAKIAYNTFTTSNKMNYEIYDLNNNKLFSHQQTDCEGNFNTILNSGTYYIKVYGLNGKYEIKTKTEYLKETGAEPNNTSAQASKVSGIIYGVLSLNDNVDFYHFNMDKNGLIRINIASYTEYNNGLKVELLDSNLKVVEYWNIYSNTNNPKVTNKNIKVIIPKGKYYLKVSKSSSNVCYQISIGGGKEKINIEKPVIDYKAYLSTQEGSLAETTATNLQIAYASKYQTEYFEIYRSTKKDKGYKLIKTVKNTEDMAEKGKLYNVTKDNKTLTFKIRDKKLKQNKAYYYKIRAKKLVNGVISYGPYSTTRTYWTAIPKKVKLTLNNKSQAKWKKVKSAKGYVVNETYTKCLGKNIFGGNVYFTEEKSILTSKTKYNRIYNKKNKAGNKKTKVTVKAYTKHGKLYFVQGEGVTSDKSYYAYYHADKWASN